jgi:hypothetical protein
LISENSHTYSLFWCWLKCMKLLQDVNHIRIKILWKSQWKSGLIRLNYWCCTLPDCGAVDRIFLFEYRDKGLTPEIPSNCPQKLIELMQMCWKKQPQQRPVSSLFVFILFLYFTNTSTQYFDFFFLDFNVDRILKQFVQYWNNRNWNEILQSFLKRNSFNKLLFLNVSQMTLIFIYGTNLSQGLFLEQKPNIVWL